MEGGVSISGEDELPPLQELDKRKIEDIIIFLIKAFPVLESDSFSRHYLENGTNRKVNPHYRNLMGLLK